VAFRESTLQLIEDVTAVLGEYDHALTIEATSTHSRHENGLDRL
jgi:hypothetical protein